MEIADKTRKVIYMLNADEFQELLREAIDQYTSEPNPYKQQYKGCRDIVDKYGQEAVFFLKRRNESNTIKDQKRSAAEAVIREFEEGREIASSGRAETRANWAIVISVLALLLSAVSAFTD